MTDYRETLIQLQRWIKSVGTEYEEPPPPQRHADEAIREVLAEVERLKEQARLREVDCANLEVERNEALAENERLKAALKVTEEFHLKRAQLEAKIEAALALHQRDRGGCCETCDEVVELKHPCNTYRALKGE